MRKTFPPKSFVPLLVAPVSILAALLAADAQAGGGPRSLPVYEPFPTNLYSPSGLRLRDTSTALNGSDPGAFMTNYFDAGNTVGGGANWTNYWALGLSYPGLVTSTNSGAASRTGTGTSSRDAGFNISPTVTLGLGTNVYFSLLLKVTTTPTTTNLITDDGGLLGLYVDQTLKVSIIKGPVAETNIPSVYYANLLTYATPLVLNNTNLLVGAYKYVDGVNDEVDLWINPGSGFGDDTAIPPASLTTTIGTNRTSITDWRLRARATNQVAASGGFVVDEIRIATNWATVTPSTCAKAAVSGPANQTNYEGLTATFTMVPSGTSPTNQWQLSTDSGGSWNNLAEATNASYTTPTLTLSDSGKLYRCIVYVPCNSSSATSQVASLTVLPCVSAGVSGGPSNATVTAGTSADFFVTGAGSGPAYQWQLSTDSGTTWNNVTTGTGGTTNHYTTPPTIIADNGKEYRCLVTTSCNGLSATSQVATLTVVCSTAGISSPPANQTVAVGAPATFSVIATGSLRSYQWQTNSGSGWASISGATSSSYTTAPTAASDNGLQFQCVVSVSCDGSSATSSPPATLSVVAVSSVSYRSATNGNWAAPATWQWSFDSGSTWSAATASPNDANNTNISVLSSHTVTIAASVQADQLSVQAGGQITINGATLTIANSSSRPYDLDVAGTLEIDSSNPLVFNGGAASHFTGGYKWNGPSSVGAIPFPANVIWDTGSTCEIDNGTSGLPPANLAGHSFYHFYWNWIGSGSCNLTGALATVRGNLRMRGTSSSGSSVRFLAEANSTNNLSVGGDVLLDGGFITLSGGSGANTVLNMLMGGNLVMGNGATLDSRNSGSGSAANLMFTNSGGAQFLTNAGSIGHSGSGGGCPINWKVPSGAALTLAAGNLPLSPANNSTRDSVTVDGTLKSNTNQIIGGGSLAFDPGCILGGNGTNELASGLGSVTYGGALNLGSLPALNNGDSFKLFGATNYAGAFAFIAPPTPGMGLVWNTNTLTTDGILRVGNPVNTAATNIVATVSGGTLDMMWPADHTGWRLQAQTNSGGAGLGTNWVTVGGSAATNHVVAPIDATKGSVFYRLVYP